MAAEGRACKPNVATCGEVAEGRAAVFRLLKCHGARCAYLHYRRKGEMEGAMTARTLGEAGRGDARRDIPGTDGVSVMLKDGGGGNGAREIIDG